MYFYIKCFITCIQSLNNETLIQLYSDFLWSYEKYL